jgi:predicted amidohydrolase
LTATPEGSERASVALSVAQISVEQCWADPSALERNAMKVQQWYERAADKNDLVVFPELTLTGYIPLKGYDPKRKLALAEVGQRAANEALPQLVAATKGRRAAMVVGFMEPSSMRHEIHNSVALIQDGAVLGVYRKMHLPVEENHYFVPGDAPCIIDCRAGRVGLIICYDIVFPEAARLAALHGAELLCVPSNWLGIEDLQRLGATLPIARALEQQMHVIFVNGVGDLEVRGRTWHLYGASLIVSATGQVIARGGDGEEIVEGRLPVADLAAAASVFPVLRDRRPDAYGDLTAPLSRFAHFARGTSA